MTTSTHAPRVTKPDDITPALVREEIFFNVSRSRRSGYNEDEVDNFLDVVAVRIENLLQQVNDLKQPIPADRWADQIDGVLAARKSGDNDEELEAYRLLVSDILADLKHPRVQEV